MQRETKVYDKQNNLTFRNLFISIDSLFSVLFETVFNQQRPP